MSQDQSSPSSESLKFLCSFTLIWALELPIELIRDDILLCIVLLLTHIPHHMSPRTALLALILNCLEVFPHAVERSVRDCV